MTFSYDILLPGLNSPTGDSIHKPWGDQFKPKAEFTAQSHDHFPLSADHSLEDQPGTCIHQHDIAFPYRTLSKRFSIRTESPLPHLAGNEARIDHGDVHVGGSKLDV